MVSVTADTPLHRKAMIAALAVLAVKTRGFFTNGKGTARHKFAARGIMVFLMRSPGHMPVPINVRDRGRR